jgi:hypothetical protein
MKVWIVERRIKTEYGWSDWEPTWDDDAGPYDTGRQARTHAKSLQMARPDKTWQYRAKGYVREP